MIAAVQLIIKLFDFFSRSKWLTDYTYMDIYCKLSKCIGQTPCSYEHYLVFVQYTVLQCTGNVAMHFCCSEILTDYIMQKNTAVK